MSDLKDEETIYSINHLLDLRTAQHPDLEVLAVPNDDLSYTKYTYKQICAAAAILANYYTNNGILPARAKGDVTTKMTVALISHSGWDYVVQELALVRMGYCVLFVSVNNAPAAIAHLLSATSSTHIVTHSTFKPAVEEAVSQLPQDRPVKVIPQVDGSLYDTEGLKRGEKAGTTVWTTALTPQEEANHPVFVVHSSGSTGFPKPIVISHITTVRNVSQHFGYRGFTTLPLYHNHGHCCFYRAIHGAVRIYLFPQSLIPLTTGNICALLTSPDCNAEALYGVPYVLKILSEDPKGLEVLKSFKLVMFGGSACPDELGNRLVDDGVRLVGHYGLTEIGQIWTSYRDFETDKAWNWLRGAGRYAKKDVMNWMRLEERGDEKYELIVLDGFPTKVLSNQPDGSYATSDLFIKHPSMPDTFKFVGRMDDTLVMVNGEKTNPVPMELTLRQSPNISEAIMFGSGRAQVGALILLAEHLSPSLSRDDLVKLITPALDLANSKAPSHSQLSAEAIAFLPYNTPLPRADKGSFLRPKVYAAFKDVIEGVYRALEGDDEGGRKDKVKLTDIQHAQTVVLDAVKNTLGDSAKSLADDTDLFHFGLDSLQSTRIRNSLQRDLDLRGKKLPSNFVFEHPTIQQMAQYLIALGSDTTSTVASPSQTDIMQHLVEKYTQVLLDSARASGANTGYINGFGSSLLNGFGSGHANGFAPAGFTPQVVVLTGATGSLGAALLERLLIDQTVSLIYCLSRAKDDDDAERRVRESVQSRGISSNLTTSRLTHVAVADFGEDYLGLPKSLYEMIATSVTLVIHNAWPVNFNLGIGSFEPQIRGAINLMKLGLYAGRARPLQFFFSSSISAVFAWPGPGPVPEAVTDNPAVAQDMGYARSKWVVEKLCEVASAKTPVSANVLRIGQMVGDSRTGMWNETEAISLIFKSADTIHALPDLEENPSWLPVDYAARCIMELVFRRRQEARKRQCQCWHVVQPRLVHWRRILASLKKSGLKFEIVPRRVWVDRLRKSDPDPVKNPTIKLLTFFEGKYDHEDGIQPQRFPLQTTQTEAASESLRMAPEPSDELVAKWVAAWRKTGFLQ